MSESRNKVVVVRTEEAEAIGYLLFQTDTHVVLINNFSPDSIDLGPIKSIATEWIEPEVSITVIPILHVSAIVEINAD